MHIQEPIFPTGEFLGKHIGPMQRIIHEVAAFAKVSPAEITGKSRQRKYARARQLAMLICRDYVGASYPEIARAFNRDHSTVMYGIEVASQRAQDDDWDDMEAIAKRAGLVEDAQ
jgi:chromosomal replication initiation ATPase DnaA